MPSENEPKKPKDNWAPVLEKLGLNKPAPKEEEPIEQEPIIERGVYRES